MQPHVSWGVHALHNTSQMRHALMQKHTACFLLCAMTAFLSFCSTAACCLASCSRRKTAGSSSFHTESSPRSSSRTPNSSMVSSRILQATVSLVLLTRCSERQRGKKHVTRHNDAGYNRYLTDDLRATHSYKMTMQCMIAVCMEKREGFVLPRAACCLPCGR